MSKTTPRTRKTSKIEPELELNLIRDDNKSKEADTTLDMTMIYTGPKKRRNEMETVPRFIIHPEGKFYRIWGLIVTSLLMYSATVVPYRIAIHDEEPVGWIIVDNVIDVLFFLDVIVNMLLAYWDADSNLITDHKTIIGNYARSWMVLDVIACLPLNYIIEEFNSDYKSLMRVARLPRLYRLIKIAKLARMIK
jgi:hypothetical protein